MSLIQNIRVQEDEIGDIRMCQQLVGWLIYLSLTQPDIAYAISMVQQFMHTPTRIHLDAANRIIRI